MKLSSRNLRPFSEEEAKAFAEHFVVKREQPQGDSVLISGPQSSTPPVDHLSPALVPKPNRSPAPSQMPGNQAPSKRISTSSPTAVDDPPAADLGGENIEPPKPTVAPALLKGSKSPQTPSGAD